MSDKPLLNEVAVVEAEPKDPAVRKPHNSYGLSD